VGFFDLVAGHLATAVSNARAYEEERKRAEALAERALRPAVVWRKLYFGTRSQEGEIAVARLLTITRTCQLQQLSVLIYLTAAICAHRRRQRVASLLPKA
jgi:hypothetical protein